MARWVCVTLYLSSSWISEKWNTEHRVSEIWNPESKSKYDFGKIWGDWDFAAQLSEKRSTGNCWGVYHINFPQSESLCLADSG